MTRLTASENRTASAAAVVPYVCFAAFDFPSGVVRLNSSERSYTFSSNTYLGAGSLAGVSAVKESADGGPDKMEFTLSGVDNSLIVTTLTEKYHGRSVEFYVGYVDQNTDLVATPHLLWEGRMETMAIRTGVNTSVIRLVAQNRNIIWSKTAGWLYTHEHQQLLTALGTDLFFDQVNNMQDKVVRWGSNLVPTGSIRGNLRAILRDWRGG